MFIHGLEPISRFNFLELRFVYVGPAPRREITGYRSNGFPAGRRSYWSLNELRLFLASAPDF